MKYSYVCRVTLSFADLIEVIKQWSEKVDKLLVYQHDADEEVSKTHCHFLIIDSDVQHERLKRIAREEFPQLKGNESWSWKTLDPTKVKSYITYMTKGNLDPNYNKNFINADIEVAKKSWVVPGTPIAKKKQDDIAELYESFALLYNIDEPSYHNGTMDYISDRILSLCRTHTMSHIYHKTGKLPFPGTYKQTAGTLFLRVIEAQRPDYFEEALKSLKNLWY